MKNNKVVLIGGGNIGKKNTTYDTLEIDKEIVKLTEKEQPNFLFIGFASSYSDSYYDTLKKHYKELGCNTNHLKKKTIENNKEFAISLMKNADIIYLGAGDSISLKEAIEQYELKSPLKEACQRGCIMVGISAGAILLSNLGYSDSYILRKEKDTYEWIEGLSLVDINICPHYEEDSVRGKNLLQECKKRKIEVYGIPDRNALIIINKKIQFFPIKENHITRIKEKTG